MDPLEEIDLQQEGSNLHESVSLEVLPLDWLKRKGQSTEERGNGIRTRDPSGD